MRGRRLASRRPFVWASLRQRLRARSAYPSRAIPRYASRDNAAGATTPIVGGTDEILVQGMLAVAALATVSVPAVRAARRLSRAQHHRHRPVPAGRRLRHHGAAGHVEARRNALKQTVVIDNRAGANGGLGAVAMKQAAPDGYTLLVGSIGVFAINPVLYKNLRYDPQKDFDLLSQVVRTPNVLVASPSFPANTVGELIDVPEEESRQGHLRIVGHRLVGPSHRRAVLAEDRHHRHPRALQGRRPCHQ